MKNLEVEFGCSGFCSRINYFLFSDVNRKEIPNRDCRTELITYMNSRTVLFICAASLIAFTHIFACSSSYSLILGENRNRNIAFITDK